MAAPLTIPITGGKVASTGFSLSKVPWSGIGNFLGGLGAIGGLFGGGSSGIKGSDLRKMQRIQREDARYMAENEYLWRTRGAKRAGLHPLFAMGGSPMQSPTYNVGGYSREANTAAAISAAGGALSKMGQAQMAKEVHNASLEESAARTRESNARADYNNIQSEAAWNEMHKAEQKPRTDLWIDVYDQKTGQTFPVPNPALNFEMPESVGGYYFGKGQSYRPGQHWTP